MLNRVRSKGCNCWVVRNPSDYKRYSKGPTVRGDKNSKPKYSKIKCKHALQVKAATVALNKAKLADDSDDEEQIWGADSDQDQDSDTS